MQAIDHIVAATDFSAPARHACERAAMLCRDSKAQLDVLHVASLSRLEQIWHVVGSSAEQLRDKVRGAAQIQLDILTQGLQQRFGVKARQCLRTGHLLEELTGLASREGADLLVCGDRGESLIRHFVLGTTAARMLSTAVCPVLVVKHPPHEPYRRLLVPVDFSASSARAVHLARRLAPAAELILMHVLESPFEGYMRYASVEPQVIEHYDQAARQQAMEQLQSLREQAALQADACSLVVVKGHPALRILEQEQERDCDLVVMGKHGQNLFDKMLLGSVTRRVLDECQGDVLVSV